MTTKSNIKKYNVLHHACKNVIAAVILLTLAPVMTYAQSNAPVINTHPSDVTIIEGDNASFTVSATGSGTLSYHWHYRVNSSSSWVQISSNSGIYSGAGTVTLQLTKVPYSYNGYQYMCEVHNNVGSIAYAGSSSVATLTIKPPVVTAPSIITHPQSQTKEVGENNISFSVTAAGSDPLVYHWEGSTDNGSTWTTLPKSILGGGDNTWTSPRLVAAQNGMQIRCTVSNSAGSVTSNPATLTVNSREPGISNITNQTATEGSESSFSITATGNGTLSYQWQTLDGKTWINILERNPISGVTTETLTIDKVSAIMNGALFRCVVTHTESPANPVTVYSNSATLTVTSGGGATPVITTQPSDEKITPGGDVRFSVEVQYNGTVTYQWQYRSSGPFFSPWTNVPNSGIYSGATSDRLTLMNVSDTYNGYAYRCVISTPSGDVTSKEATLTVTSVAVDPPVITSQPVSVSIMEGGVATFTVNATGEGLQYQWQQVVYWDMETVYDMTDDWDEFSGTTTSVLTMSSLYPMWNGGQEMLFRCKVTSSLLPDAPVYTNIVTLTIHEGTLTFSPPATVTVKEGGATSISANVSYTGLLPLYYRWWYLGYDPYYDDYFWKWVEDDDIFSGSQTATLTLKNTPNYLDGAMFDCIIYKVWMGSEGGYSSEFGTTLYVEIPGPGFTSHPSDRTIMQGTNTTFSVSAINNNEWCNFTYQWYVYDNCGDCDPKEVQDGGVYSGAQTATLKLTNVPISYSGYQYYCRVFDHCEWSDNSNIATLTVVTESAAMPAILTHPADQTIMQHAGTFFAVTTANPDKITYQYQWQHRANANNDFSDIPNGGVYSDTRTATLILTDVPDSFNDYQYRCRVMAREWNDWMEYSNVATLTVTTNGVPPTITTTSLPSAQQGKSYSATLSARGTAPITWSITAGSLPSGLSLNTTTGVISGTARTTGSLQFTVRATNQYGNDSKAFTFVVTEPSSTPAVIEVTSPPASQPFCTESNVASIPFSKLDTEHTMQYSLRFSDDAKTAGFKDTPFANLPADMAFKIDIPPGAPSRSYSAVVIITSNATTAFQNEYPFTFSVANNGVVIINQPPAFQSLCGAASVALTVEIEGNANSYQWYINGQAIAGARAKEYIADKGGNYYVEVMGQCGVIRSAVSEVYAPAADPGAVNIKTKWGNVLYVENASDKYLSYQWYHDGVAIPGETFVYITVKEGFLGSYSVKCFKSDGTIDETCPVVFETRTRTGVALYPTLLKANEELNIDVTDAGLDAEATIEIYSLLGVKVYSTTINTPFATIRPNIQIKGNYFVKIKLSSGEVINEKIVVQ